MENKLINGAKLERRIQNAIRYDISCSGNHNFRDGMQAALLLLREMPSEQCDIVNDVIMRVERMERLADMQKGINMQMFALLKEIKRSLESEENEHGEN